VQGGREDGERGVVRLRSGGEGIRFELRGKGVGLLDKVVFRFRLFGHDSGWRQTRATHVEYQDLQPGSYDFLVQAVDSDLNYSGTAEMKVIVSEDPWNEALATIPVGQRFGAMGQLGRILVIAEGDGFASNCRRLITRYGHEVEIRSSFAAGVEYLSNARCDLVLLPAVPQVPLLLQRIWALRGREEGADVLILSVYEALRAAQECVRLGAAGYVMRTSEPLELMEHIQAVLRVRWDPLAAYLRDHAGEATTRDAIAELFDMSPGTVLNHVTRCTGMSFARFQQLVRVHRSMGLLVYTRMNVQQIAGRVGMTPAALTRAFRQVSGQSPVQFRRLARMPT
jgi:AraC-like DNA-binding protein